MWQAIQYIGSGLTLAAFIVAVIAWTLKSKSEERAKMIGLAQEDERAGLVRDALEFFRVETSGLTKAQQYQLALEQIRARAQRFKTLAFVVCFVATISAVLVVFAINKSSTANSGTGGSVGTTNHTPAVSVSITGNQNPVIIGSNNTVNIGDSDPSAARGDFRSQQQRVNDRYEKAKKTILAPIVSGMKEHNAIHDAVMALDAVAGRLSVPVRFPVGHVSKAEWLQLGEMLDKLNVELELLERDFGIYETTGNPPTREAYHQKWKKRFEELMTAVGAVDPIMEKIVRPPPK